ncbi:TIGR03862 family flavoprotein [Glaciimonas soli]|uniref:TIGR03862 family flavoprotein n=1 Tax=Glaciimonas soli TaxID=2590999 RepID=A0A843YNX6_9BURK|nr:TIGR03862 family flavoprotein [Glaciimonas soli]MQR01539.1 TIGR03862 family flavoprotein [Glaciimonas soli]
MLNSHKVVIIGGGPAGLMAAEVLSNNGAEVHLYDAMPSVGRKFLLAGKGGMNLTHSEPLPDFLTRYAERQEDLTPIINNFNPAALRDWVQSLNIDTFVGSSGRVFPSDMKAAPLLRAWLQRLRQAGVTFHMRHRWQGWDNAQQLIFATPDGAITASADAVVLALGGGSWARLGSDGSWIPFLEQRHVTVAPLRPSNCGFNVDWSAYFQERFAGNHLKSVAISLPDMSETAEGTADKTTIYRKQGEFIISADGVEGSLIYAISAQLRDRIASHGSARIHLDLLPDWSLQRVADEVSRPRGARSWSSHLQSRLGLKGVKIGLLRECAMDDFNDPEQLANTIKALPITLIAARPIDEAISSAGGVPFEALNHDLMLNAVPGVFCTGEMLDWEAPTGGYLLTACFATGRHAAQGVLTWLKSRES